MLIVVSCSILLILSMTYFVAQFPYSKVILSLALFSIATSLIIYRFFSIKASYSYIFLILIVYSLLLFFTVKKWARARKQPRE
jgi:predicted tellurium resistance membrane protein TerC